MMQPLAEKGTNEPLKPRSPRLQHKTQGWYFQASGVVFSGFRGGVFRLQVVFFCFGVVSSGFRGGIFWLRVVSWGFRGGICRLQEWCLETSGVVFVGFRGGICRLQRWCLQASGVVFVGFRAVFSGLRGGIFSPQEWYFSCGFPSRALGVVFSESLVGLSQPSTNLKWPQTLFNFP